MQRKLILLFTILLCLSQAKTQSLYFPPISGTVWETTAPVDLNWCESEIPALYSYLAENNTKAFILLKDGKIVFGKVF